MKKVHLLARFCAAMVLVTISIALFFGRPLQNRFPWLIELIPWIAVVIFILLGTYIHTRFRTLILEKNIDLQHRDIRKKFLVSLVFVLGTVALCEWLTILKIERVHFLKYGLLAFFLVYSQIKASFKQRLTNGALLSMGVGILEESAQYFVPGRVFDLRDIQMNIVGAICGAGLAWLVWQWRTPD